MSRQIDSRQRRWRGILLPMFLVLNSLASCQTKRDVRGSRDVVVVLAPAAGEVRRVFVSEGVVVNEGAAILEIAVRPDVQATPQSTTDDSKSRAVKNIVAAQLELEAARAEVIRTEVEVQRLTPLVSSGDVPQAQLDGARAEYERAQQRLRKAQEASNDAQAGLVAARQPSRNPTPAPAAVEQIVIVRATSAGTVTAISVQVGARVVASQPVVTLRRN